MTEEQDDLARMPVPANEPDWLTLGQAAKYLGMAQSTIRKWSDSGRLPAFYTPGGHRRYRRSDLDQFLERGGAASPRRPEGARRLILLDVMMPKVDGWEMLRRVHERHGVGSIPVIMFSGKVEEESMRTATSRGAQGFIGKPFNPQQLIESTKQLVPA
jgi:excisionase family DNA binding protein